MLTQKYQIKIRSKLNNIYKLSISKKDINNIENEIIQIIKKFKYSHFVSVIINFVQMIFLVLILI